MVRWMEERQVDRGTGERPITTRPDSYRDGYLSRVRVVVVDPTGVTCVMGVEDGPRRTRNISVSN